MIELLYFLSAAIWRASWQATFLAVLVLLMIFVLGERVSARWRHLLWCVVLTRLLLLLPIATPFSLFNLFEARPAVTSDQPDSPKILVVSKTIPANVDVVSHQPPELSHVGALESPPPRQAALDATPLPIAAEKNERLSVDSEHFRLTLRSLWAVIPAKSELQMVLVFAWLIGFSFMFVRLSVNAVILRQRLSACRPLNDPVVLEMLTSERERMAISRVPALLVTPEPVSPFLVGTFRPRIVIPETILSADSDHWLRHVISHELAHLRRGDAWVNWLLLLACALHWFNPIAWWITRRVQDESEAACDQLAVASLGEVHRSSYATTLVDLASCLSAPNMTPALIGVVSSPNRLQSRIERLIRPSTAHPISPAWMLCIVLVIGVLGLTDVSGTKAADPPPAAKSNDKSTEPAHDNGAPTGDHRVTLRGRCLDHQTSQPMPGARVRMFEAKGRSLPIAEIANVVTDQDGRFEFADMVSPRANDPVDQLIYLIFAEADGRPIGYGGTWTLDEPDAFNREIRFLQESRRLAGKVVNSRGKPVVGASVAVGWDIDGRHCPGILSDVTGAQGQFEIDRIQVIKGINGTSFSVFHPDYPKVNLNAATSFDDLNVTLPDGCRVTGIVKDEVTGKPAARTVVLARGVEAFTEIPAIPGPDGRFQVVLAEGTYDFLAMNKNRVMAALTKRECLAGTTHELPPLSLTAGGVIEGRVLNPATGEVLTLGNSGHPITIGFAGPSNPMTGNRIPHVPQVTVDEAGRYRIRVAAGANYPYFINIQGDRMGWDTQKQPPVIAKEGETTHYDMLVTPKISPQEKLKAARELIAKLPKEPRERTARILEEFRKLNHTVDECELWCNLMRELVALGPSVVPQICEELDQTKSDRSLRRLAFALRAIGDARAVPALIRAIPRTLLPAASDYGLIVEDAELAAWMRKHQLEGGGGAGTHFGFGRAAREISGTLNKLTNQGFEDQEFARISLSEDPRRQIIQRRVYIRFAERWNDWWELNGRRLVGDKFVSVELPEFDEALPAAVAELGPNAKLGDRTIGTVLSPANANGRFVRHFVDLDTGYEPDWPAVLPKDSAKLDDRKVGEWAKISGVDLMCVQYKNPDGSQSA